MQQAKHNPEGTTTGLTGRLGVLDKLGVTDSHGFKDKPGIGFTGSKGLTKLRTGFTGSERLTKLETDWIGMAHLSGINTASRDTGAAGGRYSRTCCRLSNKNRVPLVTPTW